MLDALWVRVQQTRALAEMRAGMFGYHSAVPMLLTHTADMQMHVHMTPSGCPDGVKMTSTSFLLRFSPLATECHITAATE